VFRKFVFEYIDKFFALEDTEGLHSLTFLLKKVSKNNNGFEDLKVSLSYHFLFPCSAKLAKTCSQHVSLRSNSFELVTEKENKRSASADVVRSWALKIYFSNDNKEDNEILEPKRIPAFVEAKFFVYFFTVKKVKEVIVL